MAHTRTAEQQKALDDLLLMGAQCGSLQVIQRAIDRGADVDAQGDSPFSWTPLEYAAVNGNFNAAKILLEAGTDIDKRNHLQRTPLHMAARANQTHVIEMLLAAGADPALKDKQNDTPISDAREQGHAKLADYLQAIADGKTTRPTPESVGLDIDKRIAALDALGKPLGKFTELEKRRQAQRDTREAQRQEALNSPDCGI